MALPELTKKEIKIEDIKSSELLSDQNTRFAFLIINEGKELKFNFTEIKEKGDESLKKEYESVITLKEFKKMKYFSICDSIRSVTERLMILLKEQNQQILFETDQNLKLVFVRPQKHKKIEFVVPCKINFAELKLQRQFELDQRKLEEKKQEEMHGQLQNTMTDVEALKLKNAELEKMVKTLNSEVTDLKDIVKKKKKKKNEDGEEEEEEEEEEE